MDCSSFFRIRRIRAVSGCSAIDETAWGCASDELRSDSGRVSPPGQPAFRHTPAAVGCGPPRTRRSSVLAPAAPSRKGSTPSAERTTATRRPVAADSPGCRSGDVGQFVQNTISSCCGSQPASAAAGSRIIGRSTPTRIGAAIRSQTATPTRYDIFKEMAKCRHISLIRASSNGRLCRRRRSAPSSPAVVSTKLKGAPKTQSHGSHIAARLRSCQQSFAGSALGRPMAVAVAAVASDYAGAGSRHRRAHLLGSVASG